MVFSALTLSAAAAVTGCRAKTQEAVKEDVRDGAERTKSGIETGAEKAGKGIRTGVEKAGEGIGIGLEKAGQGLQRAGDKITGRGRPDAGADAGN
ncbi:hypothetical protein [Pendulispora albinea]|uniref:Lipoprotein n=1 Tax=Pendulispora albinea TaxID=2741071 RepID=A0ABZ2LXF5_9BACT